MNKEDLKLYKAYIENQITGKFNMSKIAEDFGISRTLMYYRISRIENGNQSKIKTCSENSRLDCLWKYKYKDRFSIIPDNRKKQTVILLKGIIREMKAEGFTDQKIAHFIKRNRATVTHHLKK